MNGSTSDPYRQIASLIIALPLLIALTIRITQPAFRKVWMASAVITMFFLIWLLIQSSPLPFYWLSHPVWYSFEQLGIPVVPTLSIAPETTRASITSMLLPLLVFAAMISLCQERREAVFAWKALASIGLLLAGLSVVLELFFPRANFFSQFEVGRGSFNGIFVNRNITAAFFALVAFATAAWIMLPRPAARREWPVRTGLAALGWSRVFLTAVVFLLVISILMTRSRAGASLALSCLTFAFTASIYFAPVNRRTRSQWGAVRFGRLSKLLLTVISGVAIFIFFGDPVISRMGLGSSDGRLCVWQATWRMFAERPMVGLGFGTFADAFPQYRDPECLGQSGVWIRAHNSHLELLAGLGVVGAIGALIGLCIVMTILIRGVKTRITLKSIPIFALAALFYILLHSIVDFPLQVPGLALYFAALMGAGVSVSSLTRHPDRRTLRPKENSRRSTTRSLHLSS